MEAEETGGKYWVRKTADVMVAEEGFFLPPFIGRGNALLVGGPVVNGHPVLSFHPPFICNISFGFNFFYNAFIYGRGGPMCPPNGLK